MSFRLTRNLWVGMQGDDVRYIQTMLDELNSYYHFNKQKKNLPQTGYFGNETKSFVTWFQLFVDLSPADGMVDKRTFYMMEARYNNYISSLYSSMSR